MFNGGNDQRRGRILRSPLGRKDEICFRRCHESCTVWNQLKYIKTARSPLERLLAAFWPSTPQELSPLARMSSKLQEKEKVQAETKGKEKERYREKGKGKGNACQPLHFFNNFLQFVCLDMFDLASSPAT